MKVRFKMTKYELEETIYYAIDDILWIPKHIKYRIKDAVKMAVRKCAKKIDFFDLLLDRMRLKPSACSTIKYWKSGLPDDTVFCATEEDAKALVRVLEACGIYYARPYYDDEFDAWGIVFV